MLYRFAAATLLVALLSSCSESGFTAFENPTTATTSSTSGGGGSGGDGGTGGNGGTGTGAGTGTTTDFSNIVLKSHIPLGIPDGSGGTLTTAIQYFDMGNSDDSISYVLVDSNFMNHVFKPTALGPVEIYSRPSPELILLTTSGDGNKLVSWNGRRDIIDYATGNLLSIGSALTLENTSRITDAGDVVAFNSRKDLTGANAAGVNQLFTLTTDGSEIYNQITTFTNFHPVENVVISGDGSKMFFKSTDDIIGDGSNADGSAELFSINTDGTDLTQLTSFDSMLFLTSSSTDGSVITMEIVNLAGATGIYLYTLNTTSSEFTEINVYTGTGYIIDYDLSADGSKIAYRGENNNGIPVIYRVNTDGTSRISALTHQGTMQNLRINTDGSQITFLSNIDFGKSVGLDEHPMQIYTLTLP